MLLYNIYCYAFACAYYLLVVSFVFSNNTCVIGIFQLKTTYLIFYSLAYFKFLILLVLL